MSHPKTVSRAAFQANFTKLITSTSFGEARGYNPNRQSPASKELHESGLLNALGSTDFCGSIYALFRKYRRLERERLKVGSVAARVRPTINRYRYAVKRLASCEQKLLEFTKMYGDQVEYGLCEQIISATTLIQGVAAELRRRDGMLVSGVHPALRRKHDEPSQWQLLLKKYDYELEKLGIKATDQSFWCGVNDALLTLVESEEKKLTALTRFKLVAAVSKAAGIVNVQPSTIKQFFFERSSRTGRRKKN